MNPLTLDQYHGLFGGRHLRGLIHRSGGGSGANWSSHPVWNQHRMSALTFDLVGSDNLKRCSRGICVRMVISIIGLYCEAIALAANGVIVY